MTRKGEAGALRIGSDHDLGLEEARRRVDEIAAELYKRYQLHSVWEGDHMRVTGNHVKGRISIAADEVHIDLKLGLALDMLAGPIRAGIEQAMDDHLT